MRLHYSEPDNMAWASVDDGQEGDSVWLDRSWDAGATWEPVLGKATVPGTWTGTRTLMYNLTDPTGHRRGWLRTCGDAAGVACTDWTAPTVCDARCDGTDTGQATGDTRPVGSTTLYGRTISLHVDDTGMAWGTVEQGGSGDEIWLDRSWDGGASWPDGSSLGRTSVADGQSAAHTALYATRDPKGLLYGARSAPADGRPRTRRAAAPRGPARADRARGAADALMSTTTRTRAGGRAVGGTRRRPSPR
ncbi:hypothetical protein NKH77_05115 [Streptomyces sp. M19]